MKQTSSAGRMRQALIYEEVCDRLLRGGIPAGTRIREEALAREFGVSRTPIRDVLRLLAGDGLVRLVPNVGAVAEGFTAGDVEELYDIRRSLESLAIACAAPVIPLALLHEFKTRIQVLRKTSDPDLHAKLDQDFHAALHEHARRRRLSELLNRQCRLMHHFRQLGYKNRLDLLRADSEHLAIIDALLQRETAAAIEALNVHLINSKRLTLRLLAGA